MFLDPQTTVIIFSPSQKVAEGCEDLYELSVPWEGQQNSLASCEEAGSITEEGRQVYVLQCFIHLFFNYLKDSSKCQA